MVASCDDVICPSTFRFRALGSGGGALTSGTTAVSTTETRPFNHFSSAPFGPDRPNISPRRGPQPGETSEDLTGERNTWQTSRRKDYLRVQSIFVFSDMACSV